MPCGRCLGHCLRDGHYGCAPAGHVSSRHHDGFPCWCHYWVHPLQFQSCYHIHGRYGKLVLGYMLAAISIFGAVKSAATIALLVPAIALGLPIMDTAFAILRRYKNGRPIFQPDKGHIHHRLLAMALVSVRLLFSCISSVQGFALRRTAYRSGRGLCPCPSGRTHYHHLHWCQENRHPEGSLE